MEGDHDHSHRHCDWRVGVDEDCPDWEFFNVVYIVFLASTICTLCTQVFVVAFRVFVLKESRQSFKQGDNASLLFFIISQLCNLILSAGLVSRQFDRIAAEVFWCLSQSVYFGPIMVNLHAIIGATPGLKITEFKVPSIILNQTFRFFYLSFHFLFICATFVTFMSLSDYYESTSSHELAHALWKAGLVFESVIHAINLVAMSFFTYHFKSAANERLKSIRSDLKEEKEEYEVLRLTLAKSNRIYLDSLALGPMGIIIYLTLAFYEGFFTNLVFTKVAAVILFNVSTVPAFFVMLGYAYVDIRKAQLAKRRTRSGGNSSSHRNDVKMALGQDTTSSPDPIQEFLDRTA